MEAATSNAASVTPAAQGNAGQAEKTAPGTQAQDPKASQGTKPTDAKTAPVEAEEFEDIKIGAVGGKVPKSLAKAMKELERGFQAKSQENATTQKQFQALAKAFKENPDIGFQVFGVDPDQYSQARMAKWLEQEMLSPEQKRMRELEDRDKKWSQREAEDKKKQEQDQLTAAEAKEETEIKSSLLKAWKEAFPLAEGGEPDPWIGQKIVATYMAAQDQELGWTWEQCAARVKQDFESSDRRRLSKMPVEAIREMLGDEILKKLREEDVKRVTDKASQSAAKKTQSKASPGRSPASPKKNFEGRTVVSQSDWDDAWDNL